jgi:hypothetical protein
MSHSDQQRPVLSRRAVTDSRSVIEEQGPSSYRYFPRPIPGWGVEKHAFHSVRWFMGR